jgi:uncharacterized protein
VPHFALMCFDKPNSLDLRMATRSAHLAYVGERSDLRMGGPLLDDAGQMAGSLMILEAPDIEAARAFSANDPYTKAGLWERADIREVRVTLGKF